MAANYEVVNRDNDGLHTYLAHQGKPAALKIYESPTSAAGSLKDLRSLNEVVSAEAETSACVVVSGVSGYSSFLNGIYNRIEEILHHGRPVYRRDVKVPHGNTAALAKHLYMYFKEKQGSWVIGLRIGAAGVLAFTKSQSQNPYTGERANSSPESYWLVTDVQGRFHEDPSVRMATAQGLTCRAKKSDLTEAATCSPTGVLPISWSRHHASKLLKKRFEQKRAQAGDYVVRHSTSVPNVLIISALAADGSVKHARIDSFQQQFHVGSAKVASWSELVDLLTSKQMQLVDGPFPMLRRIQFLDDDTTA